MVELNEFQGTLLATVCVDVEGTGWVDHVGETGSVTEDGVLRGEVTPPLPPKTSLLTGSSLLQLHFELLVKRCGCTEDSQIVLTCWDIRAY